MKTMTNRECALAILRYNNYDRLPIVHFGYWRETLTKGRSWASTLIKDDVASIPAEIDHLLKTHADWEEHYLPKLRFSKDRIENSEVNVNGQLLPFYAGGADRAMA